MFSQVNINKFLVQSISWNCIDYLNLRDFLRKNRIDSFRFLYSFYFSFCYQCNNLIMLNLQHKCLKIAVYTDKKFFLRNSQIVLMISIIDVDIYRLFLTVTVSARRLCQRSERSMREFHCSDSLLTSRRILRVSSLACSSALL
jgi:hypothetical protein